MAEREKGTRAEAIALAETSKDAETYQLTSRDLKLHTHSSLGWAAHVTNTDRFGCVPITLTADRGPTSSVR